jgi:hypothetical protein
MCGPIVELRISHICLGSYRHTNVLGITLEEIIIIIFVHYILQSSSDKIGPYCGVSVKMEAVRSSESSANFYRNSRCHISEYINVNAVSSQSQKAVNVWRLKRWNGRHGTKTRATRSVSQLPCVQRLQPHQSHLHGGSHPIHAHQRDVEKCFWHVLVCVPRFSLIALCNCSETGTKLNEIRGIRKQDRGTSFEG